jgi:hypothetical protein
MTDTRRPAPAGAGRRVQPRLDESLTGSVSHEMSTSDLSAAMPGRHRIGTVAGFGLECWPTSRRNSGRLPVGISGRLRRNTHTAALFAAVLSGDFTITGFRNRDLQGKLYPAAARDAAETKRRTHRTSRLIAKLRGHGLITRVKNTRLYRLTARGLKAMWPAVRFRRIDFPSAFREAQAA